MPPSNAKSAASAKDKAPRKSSGAAKSSTKIITLKVSPDRLRGILSPGSSIKEDTPMKDSKPSPGSVSTPTAAPNAGASTDNLAVSDSNPATPSGGANGNGTPVPSVMGPPEKKKGVKRSAAAASGDGKAKGKPGPKKRQRNEDGTLIEPTARGNTHRLGPKANQGAINAGLRALDRSGKPCRKWNRGGFRLKTFTGVEWEISRWTAPPKPVAPVTVEMSADGVTGANTPEGGINGVLNPASGVVSTASSSKENTNSNKENGVNGAGSDKLQLPTGNGHKSEDINSNSNSVVDVEMQSMPSSIPASSPAPTPVAAGA